MDYKIEFLPEAEKDFVGLDGSTKKDVARKIRCEKSHFVQSNPRFSQRRRYGRADAVCVSAVRWSNKAIIG
jgi:mRNA-degrading endonuclease RelE of RelBE toxin-antitoxin system